MQEGDSKMIGKRIWGSHLVLVLAVIGGFAMQAIACIANPPMTARTRTRCEPHILLPIIFESPSCIKVRDLFLHRTTGMKHALRYYVAFEGLWVIPGVIRS